jgi:hypothetical protein
MHADAVRAILQQRGSVYGNEHAVARLAGAMFNAATDELPPLPNAQFTYVFLLCFKCARAITGALGGEYRGDNSLDGGAYEALLASASSGKPLADVLP